VNPDVPWLFDDAGLERAAVYGEMHAGASERDRAAPRILVVWY
jgi:hypothetical protein